MLAVYAPKRRLVNPIVGAYGQRCRLRTKRIPQHIHQVKLLRGVSSLTRQARIEVVWATEVKLDVMPLYRRCVGLGDRWIWEA